MEEVHSMPQGDDVGRSRQCAGRERPAGAGTNALLGSKCGVLWGSWAKGGLLSSD